MFVIVSKAPSKTFNCFLKIFSDLYDVVFPKKEIEIKGKYLNTPWITKWIRKSSKRKQRLYEKYLNGRSKENEKTYKNIKTYKNLFERIKKKYEEKLLSRYNQDLKMVYEIHGK